MRRSAVSAVLHENASITNTHAHTRNKDTSATSAHSKLQELSPVPKIIIFLSVIRPNKLQSFSPPQLVDMFVVTHDNTHTLTTNFNTPHMSFSTNRYHNSDFLEVIFHPAQNGPTSANLACLIRFPWVSPSNMRQTLSYYRYPILSKRAAYILTDLDVHHAVLSIVLCASAPAARCCA